MNLTELFKLFFVLGVVGEVVNFVWITFEIVEFFDGFAVGHEEFHRGWHFTGGRNATKFLHGDSFFGSVHVLEVGLERFVVADVTVTLIPDAANDVVTFVHAVTGSVNIFVGRREVFAKEGTPLGHGRGGKAGEVEGGVAEVE